MNTNDIQGKLKVMLKMQDDLNKQVFPDWRERKLAWHRAIYVEAAEYLEHLGTWKWWKKGEPDFPQANMELVDIWHFGLSWSLEHLYRTDIEHLAKLLAHQVSHSLGHIARMRGEVSVDDVPAEERHAQVDILVCAAGDQDFALHAFVTLLVLSGMDFDELYRRYVGKNILNRFRQDNGYKTGTYVKVWGGREDNVHLNEILETLNVDEQLPDAVYVALAARYTAAIKETNDVL